jgi:hypothetical protein
MANGVPKIQRVAQPPRLPFIVRDHARFDPTGTLDHRLNGCALQGQTRAQVGLQEAEERGVGDDAVLDHLAQP